MRPAPDLSEISEVAYDPDNGTQCWCGVDLDTLDAGKAPESVWQDERGDYCCSEECTGRATAIRVHERRLATDERYEHACEFPKHAGRLYR